MKIIYTKDLPNGISVEINEYLIVGGEEDEREYQETR